MLLTIITFVEQDAELSQLRQIVDQLQEEKEKASGRAEKLIEELKGEYFVVGVIAEVTSSFDGSFWCLQNTVEGPRASSTCWS